ncbi:MAG: DUF2092 domain-containing protein [Gammaproteobacteria bacterium]|nr:DUF2092 domain-containing protein [Gammaproteobacteria bacterium]
MKVKPRSIIGFCLVTLVAFGFATQAADPDHDPRALDVLQRMVEFKATLKKVRLEGEVYADARVGAGLMAINSSTIEVQIQRPDSMHVTIRDDIETKELYFQNGTLTVFNSANGYYAQAEVPPSIGDAVEFAVEEFGIDAPVLDLLHRNAAQQLTEGADEIIYLTQSTVRGVLCDQIAVRLPEVDLQIWVSAGDEPLPRKIVLTSKWEGGAPRHTTFMTWDTNPRLRKSTFEFRPPEGATEIQFAPAH